MKILHVIFSTNRLKYLTKTIESHSLLDYGNHQVDKLIIDDFPTTRNDAIFDLISKSNGFRLNLHAQNLGLSVTWTELFDYLRTTDYDYVLHQEDDVVLKVPIKLDDLIQILESDPKMASVVLQRQPWYYYEKDSTPENDDVVIGNYRYSRNNKIFSIIFSLYRKNISFYQFKEYWKFNLNEGMIMVYLEYYFQMYSACLKSIDGKNLIEHIGEESIGKRVLEGEPNHDKFAHIDPNKFYSSRTGILVD